MKETRTIKLLRSSFLGYMLMEITNVQNQKALSSCPICSCCSSTAISVLQKSQMSVLLTMVQ